MGAIMREVVKKLICPYCGRKLKRLKNYSPATWFCFGREHWRYFTTRKHG